MEAGHQKSSETETMDHVRTYQHVLLEASIDNHNDVCALGIYIELLTCTKSHRYNHLLVLIEEFLAMLLG